MLKYFDHIGIKSQIISLKFICLLVFLNVATRRKYYLSGLCILFLDSAALDL